MTKATFIQYLQHPELIATAPLAEVEALAHQYPYSTNAQVLLALYAELSADPRREALFARAATMTFDRGHLYDLFTALHQPQAPVAEEESLELLPLEEIGGAEPILLGSAFKPTATALPYPDLSTDEDDVLGGSEQQASTKFSKEGTWNYSEPPLAAADFDTSERENEPLSVPTTEAPTESSALSDALEAEALTDTDQDSLDSTPPPSASDQLRPRPPATFAQRRPIATREELRHRLQLIRQRQALGAVEGPAVKKVARRSLVVSDGAISSTLAEVFKEQGQYQHAIRVYEQLALANPEKRPIFAALIQDLKRKIP